MKEKTRWNTNRTKREPQNIFHCTKQKDIRQAQRGKNAMA
jgi:hypothetical protein